MNSEEKKAKARARAKAWREVNPQRFIDAIAKCKAAKPEKYAALQRKWHKENSAHQRSKGAEWRAAHPERSNAFSVKWRKLNPEKRKQITRKYALANQDKLNAIYARRRAAKKNAAPKWANQFFISETYHLAKLRTKALGFPWHVDHIVPLQSPLVCGLHVEQNLQVIPGKQNLSKNNRSWPDMP